MMKGEKEGGRVVVEGYRIVNSSDLRIWGKCSRWCRRKCCRETRWELVELGQTERRGGFQHLQDRGDPSGGGLRVHGVGRRLVE